MPEPASPAARRALHPRPLPPAARERAFRALKWASFTHSAIYLGLLTVWIVPGLHREEFILGMSHGIGWIVMCIASLEAVRRRVIPLRLGVAVAVVGAIGPFVGSAEFVREQRRRRARATEPAGRYSQGPHGG